MAEEGLPKADGAGADVTTASGTSSRSQGDGAGGAPPRRVARQAREEGRTCRRAGPSGATRRRRRRAPRWTRPRCCSRARRTPAAAPGGRLRHRRSRRRSCGQRESARRAKKARALLERAEDIEIEPVSERLTADSTAFRDTSSSPIGDRVAGGADAFRRAASGRAAPGAHERARPARRPRRRRPRAGPADARRGPGLRRDTPGPGARHAFFGGTRSGGPVAIADDADARAGRGGARRARGTCALVEESRCQQRHRDAGVVRATARPCARARAAARRARAPHRPDRPGTGDAAFAPAARCPTVDRRRALSARRLTDESPPRCARSRRSLSPSGSTAPIHFDRARRSCASTSPSPTARSSTSGSTAPTSTTRSASRS